MKNIYTTIAAFLLIIAAVWNIKCESDKKEVRERQQAAFLQYIHENSKIYKKSLKQDSIFAQRLDSIKLLQGRNGKERIDSIRLK